MSQREATPYQQGDWVAYRGELTPVLRVDPHDRFHPVAIQGPLGKHMWPPIRDIRPATLDEIAQACMASPEDAP